MKYFVTVNGELHEVVLVERTDRLEVSLDGEPVDVRFEEVDRLGQVALFLGTKSFAVSIEGKESEALVSVAGHLYEVELEDERERAAHQAERARGGGGGDVKSVMPGVVVQLLVAEGDTVARDQPLLILEAMKMQNEIRSPAEGVVERVHVETGQPVQSGAKLVTLARPSEA